MADITSDDFRRLLEETQNTNKLLSKMAKGGGFANSSSHKSGSGNNGHDSANARRILEENSKLVKTTGLVNSSQKKFLELMGGNNAALSKYNRTVKEASKAAHDSGGHLNVFGKAAIAAGTALSAFAAAISSEMKKSTKIYQEMSSVGQTFSGSILQMQIAAAHAAVPLDEFARVIKSNATLMATLGTKPFFEMSKALRNSMTDVGQLGMTTGQMNDFMAQYMETQRLYGNLSGISQERATASMKSLAIETQKAAEMTGANRDSLMKATMQIMQNETVRARMLLMGTQGNQAFGDAMAKATTYLAALPGEAGKTLSNMLAESVGGGSALLSSQMQTFVDAGLFGVTDMMDQLRKKVESGNITNQDMDQFNKKFVEEGMKNMASLRFQASTGNQAAKQAIQMISEMKEIPKKSPQDLAQQKGITNFVLNLENMFNKFSGFIREKFYSSIERLMKNFDGYADSPSFQRLLDSAGSLATKFGNFLSEYITPERIEAFGYGLMKIMDVLVNATTIMIQAVDKVSSWFGWLADKITLAGAAFAVFAAYKVGTGTYNKAKGLLGEKFKIGGDKPLSNDAFRQGVQQMGQSFAQALGQYAAGNSLRTTDSNGIGFDRRRGPRGRGTGRVPPRIPTTIPQDIHGPSQPLSEKMLNKMDNYANAAQDFRSRSNQALGQAVRHPVHTTKNVINKSYNVTKNATKNVVHKSWDITKNVSRKTVKVGKGIGSGLARGGRALMRGIGPGALIGAGLAGGLSLVPDFKGKETMQSMAEYGAMGAMFGPWGAALGAGVGAIVANWDTVSETATSAFNTLLNYDYTSPIKAIGSKIGTIGSNFMNYVSNLNFGFDSVANFAMKSFEKITTEDISKKVLTAMGPIGVAIGEADSLVKSTLGLDRVSTPNTPKPSSNKAEVNTDALNSQIADMKQQFNTLQRENTELKGQITKLMDAIVSGQQNNFAGLREQIAEAKKQSQALNTLSTQT